MPGTRTIGRLGAVAAVAAFAIGLAACGGGSSGGGGSSSYKEPSGPPVKTINIDAANLFFRPKDPVSPPGIIDVALKNVESGAHTLVFEGVPGFELQVSGDGDTDAKKIDLAKGKHVFYCTIPGHREAGMEGTLTVG